MTTQNGFLVVLKSQLPTETIYNLHYKGLYRTPPFSMEKYSEGFDDPYVFRKYVDADGLIPDKSSAREVLRQYAQIEPIENLEIIYVRVWEGVTLKSIAEGGFQFLGFDVASDRPFWSIVNDSPSPDDPYCGQFLRQLNEYGLFNHAELARSYLDTYLSHFPRDRNEGLKVWEVYRFEETL
jgi:hypothetical protein